MNLLLILLHFKRKMFRNLDNLLENETFKLRLIFNRLFDYID